MVRVFLWQFGFPPLRDIHIHIYILIFFLFVILSVPRCLFYPDLFNDCWQRAEASSASSASSSSSSFLHRVPGILPVTTLPRDLPVHVSGITNFPHRFNDTVSLCGIKLYCDTRVAVHSLQYSPPFRKEIIHI